ncbi:MAG: radical SAM protein, partial [Oscillospiraceae bacterium]|nr:radical SAM protein [Oscillospiraceae bacterium]
MAIKVGMVSLGCSKNQVDAEIILAKLRERGYQIHTDSGTCDVVIVNTCGFIESAKQESIENILEFCTLKKEGRIKVIVVTGCLAERYQQEMAKEIPEADVILGIGSNDEICDAIEKALNGEKVYSFGPKENLPLEGERIISNLPFFAYLKIAEGCDNRCTYCAIPMIRGRYRSREMDNIVAEAQHLADHGVTEINVIAQDTTRYGMDLYG